LSHLIWSVPPLVSVGCSYLDIWCSVNKQRRHPDGSPDVRQPSTELLKPTAAREVLQPLLLLATHECGLAVGPHDGRAADLADGEFRGSHRRADFRMIAFEPQGDLEWLHAGQHVDVMDPAVAGGQPIGVPGVPDVTRDASDPYVGLLGIVGPYGSMSRPRLFDSERRRDEACFVPRGIDGLVGVLMVEANEVSDLECR
jgi:hypothetical protein